MQKTLKRLTASLLAMLMILTAIPLNVSASSENETGNENTEEFISFGEGLSWYFNEANGTLTVKGTGEIPDYSEETTLEICGKVYPNFDIYGYLGVSAPDASGEEDSDVQTSSNAEDEYPDSPPWFNLSEKIKYVIIDEGITRIGNFSFATLLYLEKVTLPTTLKSIGIGAFCYDMKLKEVNFPEKLETIEDMAFGFCDIASAVLPESLTLVDEAAFMYSGLKSLKIKGIGDPDSYYDFNYCIYLSDISIPENFSSAIFCSLCPSIKTVENKSVNYSFLKDYVPNNNEPISDFHNEYQYAATKIYALTELLIAMTDETMTDEKYEELNEYLLCEYLGIKDIEELEKKIEEGLATENPILNLSHISVVCEENSEEHKYAKQYGITHKTSSEGTACDCFDLKGNVSDTLSWEINKETRTLSFKGSGEISFKYYNDEEYSYEYKTAPWLYFAGKYDTIDLSGAEISKIDENSFPYTAANEIIFGNEIEIEEEAFGTNPNIKTVVLDKATEAFNLSVLDGIGCEKIKIYNDDITLSGTLTSSDITIYGRLESAAETYAENNNLIFIPDFNNIKEADSSDFKYTSYSNGCYITKYVGKSKVVRIPEKLNGNPVLAVNRGAFTDTDVEYIIWPETLTACVGLEKCTSLKGIQLPSTVDIIEYEAFYGCTSLEYIEIPDNVKNIGEYAFYNCTSLKYVKLSENLEKIDSSAFENCISLKKIEFPASLTEIQNDAFKNCKSLTYIIVPENVQLIGGGAFDNCTSLKSAKLSCRVIQPAFSGDSALEEVVVTNTVHVLWPFTFLGCQNLKLRVENANCYIYATSISDDDGEETDTKLVEDNATIYGYTGSTAENYATYFNVNFVSIGTMASNNQTSDFKYITNADGTLTITNYVGTSKNVVIPQRISDKEVTKIGTEAFSDLWIESLVIPEGVTEVEDSAFNNCEKIKSLSLPSTLTKVGDYAFTDFYLMEKLELNSGLETIGKYGFAGWTNITELILPESLTTIGEGAFYASFALREVTLPKNVEELGERVFKWCSLLEKINVDSENPYFTSVDGILYSKDQAQLICYPEGKTDKKHTIPDTVENIGDNAFTDNTSIEEIIIPGSVTEIGESAFEGCQNLTTAVIENNSAEAVSAYSLKSRSANGTSIGAKAFKNCSKLQSVTLSENVISIGEEAFNDCGALEKIIILNKSCELSDGSIPTKTVLHAPKDSTAEAYATQNGLTFEEHCLKVEKVEKATCTKDEYTTYSCLGCGESLTEKTADATGHKNVVTDVAVAATCTSTGLTQGSHCGDCNFVIVKQTVTEKTQHDYASEITAPTCTDKGFTTYTCKGCGDCYAANETAALGHQDINDDGKCDYCGLALSANTCDHICHKTGFMAVIYKIVLFFWKLFNINQYCQCGAAHY